MENLSIIIFALGILQVILFFKIWGMTNDVKELKDALLNEILKRNHDGEYNSPYIETIASDKKTENDIDSLIQKFYIASRGIYDFDKKEGNDKDKFNKDMDYVIKDYNEMAKIAGIDYDFAQLKEGLWENLSTI